jgi:hypothetical protein
MHGRDEKCIQNFGQKPEGERETSWELIKIELDEN